MGEVVVSLAERLKARRKELGLSQAQAARELDVARTAYRLWEMEAARPSPDRWRLISRWLGVSVTTMLLAEELLSEQEATRSGIAELEFDLRSGRKWDDVAASSGGDFFAQAKAVIAEGSSSGYLTEEQTRELTAVLDRIEHERRQVDTEIWEPAELRKTFRADVNAPRAARDAVAFVAGGIPEAPLFTSRLLTSELVSSALGNGTSHRLGSVELFVAVNRSVLRVEVSGRTGGDPRGAVWTEEGFGPALVAAMSSRSGSEESGGRDVTWFELDLSAPGSPAVAQ